MWTYRAGRELDEAVEFCRRHGLEFYAINKNYPEEIFDNSISRKINANLYIDDRNLGGIPDWGEIYTQIVGDDFCGGQSNQIKRENGFVKYFSRS